MSTTPSNSQPAARCDARTTTHAFCRLEKRDLFAVNAGIPIEQALEQASHLLSCIETLVINHGVIDHEAEWTALQYLAEMARAVVDACQAQNAEFLAQAQVRAKAAREPKAEVQAAA